MASEETYEVYALRYGSRNDHSRGSSFLLEPNPEVPFGIDYYIWIIRNANRTIIVDTGFDAESAKRLNREPFDDPATLLKGFGIDPAKVETLIISHTHFDHIGALSSFPEARMHVQVADMAYATGPMMKYDYLRFPYERVQIAQMAEFVHSGRVQFHDGDSDIAPGISVHRVDGHAIGLQAVRVKTERGYVVLASDAAAFYEHFLDYRISPILVSAIEMSKSYDRLRELASSEDHIIPGHDALVGTLYPQVLDVDVPVFRLDVPPKKTIRDAVDAQKK